MEVANRSIRENPNGTAGVGGDRPRQRTEIRHYARTGQIKVDFQRLIALDTLISDPPRSLGNDLALIGWMDQKVDIFKRMFRWNAH